jgi:hypothetical protein
MLGTGSMRTGHIIHIVVTVLALLVGATGVTSAAMRAPDRAELALEAVSRALDLTDADLCGTGRVAKHPCPLCHGLPGTPSSAPAAVVFVVTPHDGWIQRQGVLRAARTRRDHHSPRAPPAFA